MSLAKTVQLLASDMGLSAMSGPYRRLYRSARMAISSGVAPDCRKADSPLFHLPRSTLLLGPLPSPSQAATQASHSGSGARTACDRFGAGGWRGMITADVLAGVFGI